MNSWTNLLLLGLFAGSPCGATWPGWKGINYLFVFGNSYSTTGFDTSLEQPNPGNPLGNPPYPGLTYSNGPNWVDFLTTTYNQSYLQTYNLAYGGATVDSDLVTPYKPTVLSLKDQVQGLFMPKYSAKPPFAPWNSDDTLFAFFIGINDVANSYKNEYDGLYGDIFKVYQSLIDQTYQAGARNFLFLNVPPVDRSPSTLQQGEKFQKQEAEAILDFNIRTAALASTIQAGYQGTRVFQFDADSLFSEILNDPTSHVETAGYKNTTDYCEEYQDGTPEWDTFIPSCQIAVNEYFWLDDLHPTFPTHNTTAREVVGLLDLL